MTLIFITITEKESQKGQAKNEVLCMFLRSYRHYNIAFSFDENFDYHYLRCIKQSNNCE